MESFYCIATEYYLADLAAGSSNPEVTYAPFAGANNFVIQNATFAEKMEYISSGTTG
jgi:hypothetical protein